jgi:iron complex transport system substrate-binding protein
MTPRPSHRRRTVAAIVLAGALVAAGCGGDDTGGESAGASGTEPSGEGFPLTVENCGRPATYEAPPERAVAVEQSPIETMLALGLEDQMVGVAAQNQTDLRSDLVDAYEEVPFLSGEQFTRELLLSVTPDVMVSRQESSFADERGLSRDSLESDGIASHVLGHDCIDGQPTWDAIYDEIVTLGRIFGVEDRAQQVVDDMRSQVEDVESRTAEVSDGPRVFFYDTGEDVPYTRGGAAIDNLMAETVGAENVFADLDEVFPEVTWEEVVERDPEVIVVIDYGEGSGFEAADRVEFLESFPPAQRITAVREDRIVVLPNHQLLLGVRSPEALRALAEGLYPDLFS